MHHLTCGISSLLHSVNLILFTVLLVHLILCISPHHSHRLRSHHPSLPLPFTPDLKLISFTNPFLHSHSYSFRTAFMDLNLYSIKGALLFVLVSAMCARLSCILSFRVHVKLSSIVSYPVPDRVKPSFVGHSDAQTLTLRAERQSARMSKITNDGLTRSGTGCFITVPFWQQ